MLNDRLIALFIFDDPEVWTWIETCKKRDLRYLRSLYFYEDLDSNTLPHLK